MSEARRLGGRFRLLELAGRGGTAEVYRAIDESTGETVAIKWALGGKAKVIADPTTERFMREGRLLAAVSSPNVVRHVGHGASEDGRAFIAVEWLGGSDLARRQRERPLDGGAVVDVILQVASGLAAIHALGGVHRDVKPSNIYVTDLPEGGVRATVIDLGIAWSEREQGLTHKGLMIGTPAYMSPEQILRNEATTPASDQFSLAVVAFELITGARAYTGDDGMSVVAKIALTDPPRLRDLSSTAPLELDAVVARAMSKEPADRYPSIAAFAEAFARATPFETFGSSAHEDPKTIVEPPSAGPSSSMASGERRVVTAVFARFARADEASAARAAFEDAVHRRGGVSHTLLSLAHVAVFGSARSTGDEAVRAASAALALSRALPHADLVVVTGRTADGISGLPLDAIERGARPLRPEGPRRVQIDEPTARLVGDAFEIHKVGSVLEMFGERRPHGFSRTFLGATSVCVGRDPEIARLEALYAQVAKDSLARAAIVVAVPGTGKSRLRQELFSRLGARDDAPDVLLGHGSAIAEGATFSLVGSAIRRKAAVRDEDALDVQRAKIARLAAPTAATAERARIEAALLQIAARGTESSATDATILRPDHVRAAFEEWLLELTTRGPVALVLEDVHWADPPSVALVDSALRNLADRPLFVLALARPEVEARFPRLFDLRSPERIDLEKLSREASAALVRNVVGDTLPAALVERVLTRADGNAFFLEELVRSVSHATPRGADEPWELPDTVLGTVQARLDALGLESKQILKAASIFGEVVTAAGVAAVLASDELDAVERALGALAADELFEERRAPERAYVFRHALLRDGAYALLLDEDRRIGHLRAAAWLTSSGERGALVLARHFELGGASTDAMPHYHRAAEHALEASDFALAVTCADKALGAGASGAAAGHLLVIKAEAKRWPGDYAAAAEAGSRAMELLDRGTRLWFAAAREVIDAHGRLGAERFVLPLIEQVWSTAHARDAIGMKITALTLAATNLLYNGDFARGGDIVGRVERLAEAERELLSAADRARVFEAQATLAALTDQLERARDGYLRALELLEPAREERRALVVCSNLSFVETQLGDVERADARLRAAIPRAERLGVETTRALLLQNHGIALRLLGRPEEARATQTRSLELFEAYKDPRLAGWSRLHLALLALDRGDLEGALAQATIVLSGGGDMQAIAAHAIVSRVSLSRGAPDEALLSARRAVEAIARVGCVEDFDVLAYVTLVEALCATGDIAGAKGALRSATARLEARVAGIQDPVLRRSFLERVPDHARAMELASALASA
ncbi:MAG: protein kinase [Polyangiaceae bacterium]